MTRGEAVIAFIERYCRVPEGTLVGQPMRLDSFQRRFILAVYDNPAGTLRAILSIARKNGKTGLIAAILLAHIAGPEAVQNSQIVSGAMSQKQAATVFKYAWKIVQLSPELSRLIRVKPTEKVLIGLARNVEYAAISREKKTAHGLSPVLAILDEVGQIRGPQDDFVDAITTAQGAYDSPLLLVISTQAPNDTDLLSVWIDDALAGKDPHTVCHVYAAPADCDLRDRDAWKAANPALGVFRSEKDVREQAEAASRMPSAEAGFRNLTLNQRVAATSPFISRSVWERNSAEPRPYAGGPVWAGLDLSAVADLTALIITYQVSGVWQVLPHFWTPAEGLADRAKRDRVDYVSWHRQGYLRTTPGATVDYDDVARDVLELCSDYSLASLSFDRWRMDVLKAALQRRNAPAKFMALLREHGQGYQSMSPAIDKLETELLNGRMAHGGHPVLTMCAANAIITRDPAGNRKLDKSKTTGRIDGIVGLAMAMGAAASHQEKPKREPTMLFFGGPKK